jgi:hypothetical protein
VKSLHGGVLESGSHEINIDGDGLPGGVYFYSLRAGDRGETRRILLVK